MSLQALVNHISEILLLQSGKQKEIINCVSSKLQTGKQKETIHSVLHNLLADVLLHSAGEQIQVAADKFNELVLVKVKHHDIRDERAIEQSLAAIRQLAKRTGGCVYVVQHYSGRTTFAFTYIRDYLSFLPLQ